VRACVRACVCVCAIVSSELHVRSSPIFVPLVTYDHRSVLLWRRSDTLCTSGFMDDIIFVHKQRLLDVVAHLKRSARAALGLAANCALYYQSQVAAIGRSGLRYGRLKYM